MAQTIIVTYPPDHDGELHILVETEVRVKQPSNAHAYEYKFRHAAKGTAWETLVAAARAIIAQDGRQRR